MAYCRFSSDDWQCDVYVYEDVGGGWTTHVAGNRVIGDVPPLKVSGAHSDVLHQAYRAQMAYLETAQRAFIGLPHDGESFNDDTPGACADRLEMLRALGYNVPQYAIDELREEQAQLSE